MIIVEREGKFLKRLGVNPFWKDDINEATVFDSPFEARSVCYRMGIENYELID